ncbi:MAG: uridine phosphorylase [Planctomycetota bacterium]|nr:MAG: uridine phosphorylase [Planctomycetota bacterium]
MSYKSAENVQDEQGRQYHIGVNQEELAPNILLVGDPARSEKVAKHFDSIRVRRQNREYHTITGTWQGLPVSVMGTGIGCGNMEIAVVEICQLLQQPTLLRVGSCGGLQKHIQLADLVISTGAVRLENVSHSYVPPGYPAIAHHALVQALIQSAQKLQYPYHVGLTATAPGFYAPQGRQIPGLAPLQPQLPETLAKLGVKNLEMEASVLFTLASLREIPAGCICTVFANRPQNTFIHPQDKDQAEQRCIQTALHALKIYHDNKANQ